MHERDQAVIRAVNHGLTRRTVLKSTLAAGGALALSTFGGGIIGRELAVSAAEDEMLPASKFTIKSTIAVNLTKGFARAPLFQGAFNGQPVWYVITEASDEGVASDIGVNFAPRLANAAAPSVQQVTSSNSVLDRGMATFAGARSSIFAFVNGQTGILGPPAQGLNHVILDGGGTKDASFQNADVLDKLFRDDAHNILDSFPTLHDPALAHLYTPLWDLQLVKWSDDAVARGVNVAQTDGNQIRQLAAQGVVHSPDDLPLVTVDIIVNCPVIGFIDQAPDAPQAADPGMSSTPFCGAP